MLVFTLPPGIGDCSWVISKVFHLFSKRDVGIKVSDGHPHRSSDFIDLLPVKNLGFTPWQFPEGAIPVTTDLDSLPDGEYKIECNSALEMGMKLNMIFPQQPTNYHYPMVTSEAMQNTAKVFLSKAKGSPRIGIYASAYTGPCPWSVEQWVLFCSNIKSNYPHAAFYVIGAKYDNRTFDLFEELKKEGYNVVSAIGEHHIGATIEVIKGLDYFFAYPSGLGILANVIHTPCMMWIYKEFPPRLIDSYANPEDILSKHHLNPPNQTVKEAFDYFMENGSQFIKSV